MTDTLLMLQLGFNAVMLVAILVLARGGARRAAPLRERPEKAAARRVRESREATAPAAALRTEPASAALRDLVARAEREELVAERSLRERLAALDAAPARAAGRGRVAG